MTIDDAYNRWAPTYDSDANRTRDLDADVMRELLTSLHVRRFIEAGCGTGKNTEFFASRAEELTALDFSREMLAKARARTRATNVAFVLHDLHAPWPVEPGATDVVSFNLVLEHVRDLAPVIALAAAESNGLRLDRVHEWWHADDSGKPPRLLTIRFLKRPHDQ